MVVLMVALIGCAEETPKNQDDMIGLWDISWQYDNETIEGKFTLINSEEGYFQVFKKEGSALLSENTFADFEWTKSTNGLSLRRKDNQIEMNYRIINENTDEIQMIYEDDVFVKLTKRQ